MKFLSACAVSLLAASLAVAELRPDEIVLIVNDASADSLAVAEHYVRARGVPESHICRLKGLRGEMLERGAWEERVRPELRRWLLEHGLDRKIRCLVTTYDVPLKIGRDAGMGPEAEARLEFLATARESRRETLAQLIDLADEILPSDAQRLEAPLREDASIQQLAKRFEAALKGANARRQQAGDKPEGKRASVVLERLFLAGGGPSTVLKSLARQQKRAKPSPRTIQRLAVMQGIVQGLRLGMNALARLPESVAKEQQQLHLVEQADGVIGGLVRIGQRIEQIGKNETYASFDSELSLLHWPAYSSLRWQTNDLSYKFDQLRAREPRTLMVSRLEAPTVELTKKIIDDAVETEKTGLTGKVYLDARGLADSVTPGSNGLYDKSLRTLATLLREHTDLEVVLDNEPRLFREGAAPDAALYCGWYSLAEYADAFDWRRGAVGYHMASGEAATLRKADSNAWCKRMLEDGVCATLGPVHEPYLQAFPAPEDFFVLLVSGKYTLVECYYRTKAFSSWVMTLVGDPLYNPFKNNPQFLGKDVPDTVKRFIGPRR